MILKGHRGCVGAGADAPLVRDGLVMWVSYRSLPKDGMDSTSTVAQCLYSVSKESVQD